MHHAIIALGSFFVAAAKLTGRVGSFSTVLSLVMALPLQPPTSDIQSGIASHGAIVIQARWSFESCATRRLTVSGRLFNLFS